ncbi:MAG TPA: ATP-binding protein [Thermoanaerobaculia bacterium]|nr:ATP-binding protein [Thermoanaerobaculia bacterium]
MIDESSLTAEVEDLRARLLEAEDMVRAIRRGEVDALVVDGAQGEQVFTLKSADHSYRIFLEEMNEGAATLNAEGVLLYCNRRFAAIVGVPLENVIGDSIFRFVREAEQAELRAVLNAGLRGAGKGELSLLNGGQPVPVYLAASALPLDEIDAVCLVVTDLTEQKRNQEMVAAEKLANQAKDHFLATLSHELRTPLTPVLAVISGLQEDKRLPDDVRMHLAMVRRNVELEARLIDDMLDLTRVSRGKLELHREAADLRQVIDHALQTASGDLLAKRLKLVLDLSTADHTLWADTPRVIQVFWNLFSNAVKFTPSEGTIAVRSWREESAAGPHLVVEVADTGIGIEPDVLLDIFDAFQQGEQAITRRYGGLGLGLAISKAIVELHGGKLTAASDGRGRGAVFSVRLPVGDLRVRPAAPEASAAAPKDDCPEAVAAELHILLVEDHADTAEAMADLLREMGHRVTVAHSVAAGLAAAEHMGGRLDLVLSDLGLPDGTGLDLMTQLHGRYGVKGIALSGYGMEEDVRRSLEAGFERHLTKPVNLQALQMAIQETAQGA